MYNLIEQNINNAGYPKTIIDSLGLMVMLDPGEDEIWSGAAATLEDCDFISELRPAAVLACSITRMVKEMSKYLTSLPEIDIAGDDPYKSIILKDLAQPVICSTMLYTLCEAISRQYIHVVAAPSLLPVLNAIFENTKCLFGSGESCAWAAMLSKHSSRQLSEAIRYYLPDPNLRVLYEMKNHTADLAESAIVNAIDGNDPLDDEHPCFVAEEHLVAAWADKFGAFFYITADMSTDEGLNDVVSGNSRCLRLYQRGCRPRPIRYARSRPPKPMQALVRLNEADYHGQYWNIVDADRHGIAIRTRGLTRDKLPNTIAIKDTSGEATQNHYVIARVVHSYQEDDHVVVGLKFVDDDFDGRVFANSTESSAN